MKYKSKPVDGQVVYYSSDWINDLEEEIHFNWYYQQARLVYSHCTRDQRILEMGIGTGLLSDVLKKRGWNVLTLDIDEEKNPDFCCDALDFEYIKHNIDVILAFEIFEHVPFETFNKIICKLANSNIKTIKFSLPWNRLKVFDFHLKLPKLKKISFNISIPQNGITTKTHFWELSIREKVLKNKKRLIKKQSIENIFIKNGYTVSSVNIIGNIEYFSASAVAEHENDE